MSHLRNAIKGVACAQTSVPFRNAILNTKSCVHLRMFSILSAVAPLAVSLSRCQNGKSCDGSKEGAWCENGGEDRA